MKIAAIIQARMGSKRFPGKVMADLCGKPVLQHVIERTKEIGIPVILSTPNKQLASFALMRGIGASAEQEPPDVLSHYWKIAKAQRLDIIMRITGDCPLLQPALCEKVLAIFDRGRCTYAAIGYPEGGFPKGYGCEVFTKFTLKLANELATDEADREHVTPWMHRNVRCKYLQNDKDESHLNYSIDTPEDLERVRIIVQKQMIDT
jgi:spore coat polysaccharide biosynthesis protein SpsF (cytidylyltransferase family)